MVDLSDGTKISDRMGLLIWTKHILNSNVTKFLTYSFFFSLSFINGVAVNSYFDIPCDFFSGVSKDILICVAYPCSHTKRCGNDHFRQNILHLPKMQNITPHKLRGMIHFITFMKVLKELLWKMFVIINIWIK